MIFLIKITKTKIVFIVSWISLKLESVVNLWMFFQNLYVNLHLLLFLLSSNLMTKFISNLFFNCLLNLTCFYLNGGIFLRCNANMLDLYWILFLMLHLSQPAWILGCWLAGSSRRRSLSGRYAVCRRSWQRVERSGRSWSPEPELCRTGWGWGEAGWNHTIVRKS